ncbi:MAG: GAF domain-containing protein [Anaerolineales bacterium]|nr:MAG: GAF domain-containing protein [Anaerolineales bacterium]
MSKSTTGSLPPAKGAERDSIRLLLVEDNPGDARLIQEMLKDVANMELRIQHAATLKDGLQYLGDPEKPLDAVLLDLGLPDSQGFDTFTRVQEKAEAFTVIILSGLNDVDMALHAVRNGAQDYLVKGQISGELLLRSIRHAIERDEADRLLRESRERYQSLVDMMPDAIMVHQNGLVAFANPAAVKLLGISDLETLIGTPMIDVVHPEYKEIVAERIRSAEAGQSQTVLEQKFVRSDGSVIDVEVTGSPFTFEDEPATQIIFRDITERKQREREIEAVAAVSSSLRMARSVDDILPVILHQALVSINAKAATLTLVQPETGDHLIAMGRSADRDLPIGQIIPAGRGLTSRVVSTSTPYLNNQVRTNPDPDMVRFNDIPATNAVVIVPITAENHVIGTLGLGREEPIEQSDVRVLSAICDIGGAAVHRASLYEQTERRLQHLRSLHEIDNTIATSLDLKFTLDVILSQGIAELRVDAAAILLLDEEQMLNFAAGLGFKTKHIEQARIKFGDGLAGQAAKQRTIVEAADLSTGLQRNGSALAQAEGFVGYYAAPLIAKGRVIGVLETFHCSVEPRDAEWKEFLLTLAGQAAIAIDNAALFKDLQTSNESLREAYERTIEGWAHALALRDMETIEHSRRVTEMTVRLAQALGVADEQLEHVRRGALLHDIGKMGVPDHILGKAGPLDDEEWEIMRRHPAYARDMLTAIDFLYPAIPIPLYHHEKWDGSGYPEGLEGRHIPLEARIFAIIDVWDALTSKRPYRDAWPEDKVAEHLREQAGKHFDPAIVDAFFTHILKRS